MNNDRPGQDIEQQRWQSVIEAALDPAERARVQSFLAAAPLSQETPAWLDQSLLAPRRAAGATSDECATVFANLGYAALNSPPNWGTVEFAMGCAEQIGLLAAADGDLALRRRFLAAKGTLFAAALSAQPHLVWNMAAGRCAEYCNALREQAPDQPPDIVLAHATAAFALTNQLLDHLQAIRAVRHYARDIEALVDAAVQACDKLPAATLQQAFATATPGDDGRLRFRRVGIAACLGRGGDDAAKGLGWIEDILALAAEMPHLAQAADLGLKVELLLDLERAADAQSVLDDLPANDRSALSAGRCLLQAGSAAAALECLADAAPSAAGALEAWRSRWLEVTDGGYWSALEEALPLPVDEGSRRLAAAAVHAGHDATLIDSLGICSGLFADSLAAERTDWLRQLRRNAAAPDDHHGLPATAPAAPQQPDLPRLDGEALIEEVLAALGENAALLMAADAADGMVIMTAVRRDGGNGLSSSVVPADGRRLYEARTDWNRACLAAKHADDDARSQSLAQDCYGSMMDAADAVFGEAIGALVDTGASSLVLVGDEFTDLPLHALQIDGDLRLIDALPVTYAPSLGMLRACLSRPSLDVAGRPASAALGLSPYPEQLPASIRDRVQLPDPRSTTLFEELAEAELLYLHTAPAFDGYRPFQGWLALDNAVDNALPTLATLFAGLELPRCDLVVNLQCESVLTSTLRPPGFDLSALWLAAGARRVLAATTVFEPATDTAAAAQDFIDAWQTGESPSQAFRSMLRQLRERHPDVPDYQWAGLRLVGAP